MTTPNRQPDPILGILPGVVLLIVIGLLMLALLADTPTVETEDPEEDLVEVAVDVDEAVTLAEETAVAETSDEATPEVTDDAEATGEADPDEMVFDAVRVAHGEMVFQGTCTACHGFNARGITGLGKDLVESEFMDSVDEQGFIDFVVEGRPADHPQNTTGVAMPPMGGNPALTQEDLGAVYQWLRVQTAEAKGEEVAFADEEAEQAPADDAADAEATAEAGMTAEEIAEWQALFPDGSLDLSTVETDPGEIYNFACAGCHGLDGEGVAGNGPALDMEMSADELYAFLAEIVRTGDVDPNVEFPHPRRAVPFVLSDEQLEELVDYVLSLDE